jgi:hypothetical protein
MLQYRLQADCGRTVRWFSAPGKMLRMDGRVQADEKLQSGSWLSHHLDW